MNKLWIYKKLVLKVIKFIFKHRHSMDKVKLYFSIARLLQKDYRGIVALLPILTVFMQVFF